MEYSNAKNYASMTQPSATQQGPTPVTHQPAAMGIMQPQYGMIPMQPVPGQPINPPPLILTPHHFLPYDTICPHCRAQVKTKTTYTIGCYAWIWCCTLAISGLCVGCCAIPFCINSCKDATHTCPSCSKEVASYKRMHQARRARRGRVGHYF